jgi:hypothetical protein
VPSDYDRVVGHILKLTPSELLASQNYSRCIEA